jgi:purine-cytosine permease-like protein
MRLALVTAWILAGAAMTGAAYWGLLNTPESTVLALASSALLVMVTLALLSLTINGAIALWINGASAAALTRSFRRIPAIVPALLVFALCCGVAQRRDQRVVHRRVWVG